MSERVVHVLDRETGTLTSQTTSTPVESFADRVVGLEASVAEFATAPILDQYRAVICDGCGTRVEVEKLELPLGWSTDERGEFCEACS